MRYRPRQTLRVTAYEVAAYYHRPTVVDALRMQVSANQLHELISEYGDEQVPLATLFPMVEDRTQSEFRFEGAEHRLGVGEHHIGPPQLLGAPSEFVAAQAVDPGMGRHGAVDGMALPVDGLCLLAAGVGDELNVSFW